MPLTKGRSVTTLFYKDVTSTKAENAAMLPTKLINPALMAMVFLVPNLGWAVDGADGANSELLEQALTAAAQGNCPSEIMSPLLRGVCEEQMPGMGQQLSSLGKIKSMEYLGIQQTPSGPAEVYKVKFAQSTHMWMISSDPQGKAVILWSPQ